MYVEFDLPVVPEPRVAFANYWLRCVFIRGLSGNYQINALAGTYMRLVEAAVVEYALGSVALRRVWENHTSIGLGPMHRSIAHFESALSDMHRATNAYRRLRRHKSQDPLSLHLSRQKVTFATDDIARQVRDMRDEIHHLEEKVVDGRIAEGQPIALMPSGPELSHPTEQGQTIKTFDRLAIGDHHLTFANIANWLIEMCDIAALIAQFEPNQTQ